MTKFALQKMQNAMIPEIRIEDYNYTLPDERIAKYPLPQRDSSKLLIYKNENVSESSFSLISEQLPENSLMIFNDTKVVPARLHFQRSTGAHIEIFCLEPVLPEEYVSSFAATNKCRWKCIDSGNISNDNSRRSIGKIKVSFRFTERGKSGRV